METLLQPNYDSRKSFYGKARVVENDGDLELISYSTRVAWIGKRGTADEYAYVNSTYSQTTLRHIKEFLRQNGYKADTAAQILADYGAKKAL